MHVVYTQCILYSSKLVYFSIVYIGGYFWKPNSNPNSYDKNNSYYSITLLHSVVLGTFKKNHILCSIIFIIY